MTLFGSLRDVFVCQLSNGIWIGAWDAEMFVLMLTRCCRVERSITEAIGTVRNMTSGKIVWDYLDPPCERAWRKFKLRTTRERNDLLLRGLAEYWGHPSRVSFDL